MTTKPPLARARSLYAALAAALLASACNAGPPRDAAPPDAIGEPAITDPGVEPEPAEYDRPEARAIWDDARERGVHFRAIGQEPGWLLEITEGQQIEFVGDYGEWRVVVPAPPPETPGADDRTYYRVRTEAHTVDVVIEPIECYGTMSGEPFPSTVQVTVDGRSFEGCGRALR
jgi:uncharacterized membrane protein